MNHTFVGWFDTSAQTGGNQITANTVINNDMTVWARWATVTHTISFDANGGTGAPATIANVANGTNVSLPTAIPTRANHTFIGWTTAASNPAVNAGTAQHNILAATQPNNGTRTSTMMNNVTGNVTLRAVWRTNQTIIFSGNGHTGGTVPATVQTRMGASVNRPTQTPSRTGHSFSGWFTTSASSGGTQFGTTHTMGASDVIFWGRWAANLPIGIFIEQQVSGWHTVGGACSNGSHEVRISFSSNFRILQNGNVIHTGTNFNPQGMHIPGVGTITGTTFIQNNNSLCLDDSTTHGLSIGQWRPTFTGAFVRD